MIPLHTSFRRTVRRYVPKLKNQELDRYESLISLIHQLNIESGPKVPGEDMTAKRRQPETSAASPEPEPGSDVHIITDEVNDILGPYEDPYKASHKLWIARRQLAVQQGNFLQIPLTWSGLKLYLMAIGRYRWIQLLTWRVLTWSRLKYHVKNLNFWQGLVIAALLALLTYSVYKVLFVLSGR